VAEEFKMAYFLLKEKVSQKIKENYKTQIK